jgi:hypothetical protein
MTALIRNLILASAMLLIAGCVVWSTEPLSDTATAAVDASLLGKWQNAEIEGDRVEIDITRSGEHLVLIAMTTIKPDGGHTLLDYKAQTTVAGERRYLSVMDLRPGRRATGFMIVKYATTADELSISLIDEDAVKSAIRAGAIEGMIDASSEFGDATIDTRPEKLLAFLASNEAVLFPKTITFTRREEAPAATSEP